MSSTEAAFRCKASIEKTEETSNQFKNTDLKRITQITLSLMQKNLEEILHSSTLKNIPSVTQQCMQHAEHITWLKNSIDSEIKTKTPEIMKNPASDPTSGSKSKPVKKSGKKEKKIKINQETLDSKILKKVLRNKGLNSNAKNSEL